MQSLFQNRIDQDMLQRLFRELDRDGTGVLRWSTIVLAMAVMCNGDVPGLLAIAFHLFDTDGNGNLAPEELDEFLSPLLHGNGSAGEHLEAFKKEAFRDNDVS